jgi:hypothetical protein
MRSVLFAWRRSTPPFLIGGAEVTQQLLAEEFAGAGWQVTYLGSHEAPWDGSSALASMRRQLVPPGQSGQTQYRLGENHQRCAVPLRRR